MKADELRQKYLDFFKSKGHAIIASASLIPENDPTVLFTTAGMHPLVPFLMGEKHPLGKRLANYQKCIRTSDIDEVGDTTHHTFFEMLGNWSLGDYFKKEAIDWSWEFLSSPDWLNLDKKRLATSVFAGDDDAPFDREAYDKWLSLDVPAKRVAKLPKENNWWGPAGITGPCGPDTEMFYWVGEAEKVPEGFNDDNDLWVEIWNDVFMEFNKNEKGEYEKLSQQCVDTGMGLERTLAVMNGLDDNYRTELFWPIIEKIQNSCDKKYGESEEVTRSMRIIADHVKAATFILGDEKGITPSNIGQGYVLRRLIRRAICHQRRLKLKILNLSELVPSVIEIYGHVYPELLKNKIRIITAFQQEGGKFLSVIHCGDERIFDLVKEKLYSDQKKPITGKDLFEMYSVHGYPLELSFEEIDILIRNKSFDKKYYNKEEITEGFKLEMQKHQELSRTASAGMFKGGLADASEETIKYHTAAHLMLAALRQVLGNHVTQKGSNITPERLRFDFSHPQKMTPEEIKKVEDMVNLEIKKDLPVNCAEMALEDAKAGGAMGVFESKYGEKVKVYSIGDPSTGSGQVFSKEICGGPHVDHTGVLGNFKIKKEEASSAGVRRIKAILE